jgi:hypothetical protein
MTLRSSVVIQNDDGNLTEIKTLGDLCELRVLGEKSSVKP